MANKLFIQTIRHGVKGDNIIYADKQGRKYSDTNVNQNIVRCALRNDYDYFLTRSLRRDGLDFSREINSNELADFARYSE